MIFDGFSDSSTEQTRHFFISINAYFAFVYVPRIIIKKTTIYKIFKNRENNIRSVRALRDSLLTSQALAHRKFYAIFFQIRKIFAKRENHT